MVNKLQISDRSLPSRVAVISTTVNAIIDHINTLSPLPSLLRISDRSLPPRVAVIAAKVNELITKLDQSSQETLSELQISDRSLPARNAVIATAVNELVEAVNTMRQVYELDAIDDFVTSFRKEFNNTDALTFSYISPESSTSAVLFSDSVGAADVVSYDGTGTLTTLNSTFTVDGVPSAVLPFDGLSHVVVVTFTAQTFIDTWATDSGMSGGFAEGYLFNIDYNGDNFYPFDRSGWTLANRFLRDINNPQSGRSELWSANPTLGGEWVDEGSGVYSVTSVGVSNLTGATGLVNGNTYEMTFTVDSLAGGSLNVINGTSATTTGVHSTLVVPTIASAIISAPGGVSAQVSNISFKEYSHATSNNFQESSWEFRNV